MSRNGSERASLDRPELGQAGKTMPLRLSRTRFRSVMSRWRANARTRAHHAVLVVKPAAFSGRTGSPADFAAWAERGINRTGGVPDAWRGRGDLPIRVPARVAVVLHA